MDIICSSAVTIVAGGYQPGFRACPPVNRLRRYGPGARQAGAWGNGTVTMAGKRELAARLAQVPLFARCSRGDLAIVARHAETTRLEAGAVLLREGDEGDAFFVILEGTAMVTAAGRTVRQLGVGDYFGELALLDPAPRSATVTANAPVQVGVLGARMFRTLLRELPAVSERLLASLARQAREGLDFSA